MICVACTYSATIGEKYLGTKYVRNPLGEEVAPDHARPADVAQTAPVPDVHRIFEKMRRGKMHRRQQKTEPLSEFVRQVRRIHVQFFRQFHC